MASRLMWWNAAQYGPVSGTLTATMAVSANTAARNGPIFVCGIADGGVTSFTSATFTDAHGTVYNTSGIGRDDLIAQPNGDFWFFTIRAATAQLGGTLTFNFNGAFSATGGVIAVGLLDADVFEYAVGHRWPFGTTNPFTAPTINQLVSDATSGSVTSDPDVQQPIAAMFVLAMAGATSSVSSFPAGWEEIVHRTDSPAGVSQPQVVYAYAATLEINTTIGSWTLDNPSRAMSAYGIWLVPREPRSATPIATRIPPSLTRTRRADQPCQPVVEWSAQAGSSNGSVALTVAITNPVDTTTGLIATVSYWKPALSTLTLSVTYAGHALSRLSTVSSPNATVRASNGVTNVTGVLVQEVWTIKDPTIPATGTLSATVGATTDIFMVGTALRYVDTFGIPATGSGQMGTATAPMAYTAPTLTGGTWLGVFGTATGNSPFQDFDDTVLGVIWHSLTYPNTGSSSHEYYSAGSTVSPTLGTANGWIGQGAGTAPVSPLSQSNNNLWAVTLLPVTGKTPGYTTTWRAWSGTGLPMGAATQFLAANGVAPNDNLANYSSVPPQWYGEWDEVALDTSGGGNALFLKNGVVYFQGSAISGGLGTGQGTSSTTNPDGSFVTQTSGGTVQPLPVAGLPPTIVKIAYDSSTFWALAANGDLYAWGLVGSGSSRAQLGTIFPTSAQFAAPFITLTGVEDIAPGMALRHDGTVWTCGPNNSGQLGIGTTGATGSPWTQVTAFTGTPRRVIVNAPCHYIIMSDRRLLVWGAAGTSIGVNQTGAVTSPTDIGFYADDVLFSDRTVILKDGLVYNTKTVFGLIGMTSVSGLPLAVAISGIETGSTSGKMAGLLVQDNTGALWYAGSDRPFTGVALANGYETYDQFGAQIGPNTTRFIQPPVMIGGLYQQGTVIQPTGFNWSWVRGGPKMNTVVGYARVVTPDAFPAVPCPFATRRPFVDLI